MANSRKLAAAALTRVEEDGGYSNIVLDGILKKSDASGEDRALASAVFYGVLDRKITVDWLLKRHIKTPLKKVAPYTLSVLRCAVYQIAFMEKIPDSAAVNEAVKLVKASKESRNAGFVNAVLRNILRNGTDLPDGNDVHSLSVRYSCPEWIISSFQADYGSDNTVALLKESLLPPPLTVRVNTVKTNEKALTDELANEGVQAQKTDIENALIFLKGADISGLNSFKNGLFYAQDLASQRAVAVLSPKKGSRVLDMCAAPGGKSFTMAQFMENNGEIIACDLYEQRTELIKKGADRLGPVSYTHLRAHETVLEELSVLQKKILKNALLYLKNGGRLLYSTCTLRTEENEKLVNSVIMEYNGLCKAYEHTYMPHIDKTDGFYCALLVKEETAAIE